MSTVLKRFPRAVAGLNEAQDFMTDNPGTVVQIPDEGNEILVSLDDRVDNISKSEIEFGILCALMLESSGVNIEQELGFNLDEEAKKYDIDIEELRCHLESPGSWSELD